MLHAAAVGAGGLPGDSRCLRRTAFVMTIAVVAGQCGQALCNRCRYSCLVVEGPGSERAGGIADVSVQTYQVAVCLHSVFITRSRTRWRWLQCGTGGSYGSSRWTVGSRHHRRFGLHCAAGNIEMSAGSSLKRDQSELVACR